MPRPPLGAIYATGITTGRLDGTYDPAGSATRAQNATFLSNALGLLAFAPWDLEGLEGIGTVLRVPEDHDTGQAAIGAANDGEAVLVASGTYRGCVDLAGKAIIVTSEQGPEQTVLDGGRDGPVVRATSCETRDSVLHGFTVTGGLGYGPTMPEAYNHGGGMAVLDLAEPEVRDTGVADNLAVQVGAVIVLGGAGGTHDHLRIHYNVHGWDYDHADLLDYLDGN